MAETRFGSFDDLLEITAEEMRPIMSTLRRIIQGLDPGAVEVVRLGDRAATYGVGPKKMSEGYAYILPHANWVNLGFYHAYALEDPGALLEGSGARMRHVKIRSASEADRPEVIDLIGRAIQERRSANGLD